MSAHQRVIWEAWSFNINLLLDLVNVYEGMNLNPFFDKELIVLVLWRHSCSFVQCTWECWKVVVVHFVLFCTFTESDIHWPSNTSKTIVFGLQNYQSLTSNASDPLFFNYPESEVQLLVDLQSLTASKVWVVIRAWLLHILTCN